MDRIVFFFFYFSPIVYYMSVAAWLNWRMQMLSTSYWDNRQLSGSVPSLAARGIDGMSIQCQEWI